MSKQQDLPPPSYEESTAGLSPAISPQPSSDAKQANRSSVDLQSTNELFSRLYTNAASFDDPRTSSTQSLVPAESAGSDRRILLLIYIHGFMGNETSFRSFPAHVHNILTQNLSQSHVVHTKIYPRYQSRTNISLVAEDFSKWLTPRQSDTTDVILLGHSLGGILAAEVALIRSTDTNNTSVFKHNILGHLAFDTPFLGMSPSVVGAGLASLFKKPPVPPELEETSSNPADPNYNPTYENDRKQQERGGALSRALYFYKKHAGNVQEAATQYVKSHLEFGGCLADYPGLRKRYDSFRFLEDINELSFKRNAQGKIIPRLRFANYYTASTGFLKHKSSIESNPDEDAASSSMSQGRSLESNKDTLSTIVRPSSSSGARSATTPETSQLVSTTADSATNPADMQYVDPEPLSASPDLPATTVSPSTAAPQITTQASTTSESNSLTATSSSSHWTYSVSGLPDLSRPPSPPAPFNPDQYDDLTSLKQALKAHQTSQKTYEKLKKDHEKQVKDREKQIAKLEKERQDEREKLLKAKDAEQKKLAKMNDHERSEHERLKKEKERMAREEARMSGKVYEPSTAVTESTFSLASASSASNSLQKIDSENATKVRIQELEAEKAAAKAAEKAEKERKKREEEEEKQRQKEAKKAEKAASKAEAEAKKAKVDRHFCTLPGKDAKGTKTGDLDPCWIRVFMENMDEVAAHTSLFFSNTPGYKQLVGNVADKVKEWVEEKESVRRSLEHDLD